MPNLPYDHEIRRVIEAFHQGGRFLVAGHVDPDFDCVGSLLALDWVLRQLGKASLPVVADPASPHWDFLPYRHRLRSWQSVQEHEWDSMAVVDGDLSRADIHREWPSAARVVVNIDHHPTNASPETVRLLVPEAAATAELIYDLILALDLRLDADVATLLYAGIASDTGSFRYTNTTEHSLRVAADLVKAGADPGSISSHLYESHSWGYMTFLRGALQTLARSSDGLAAWITLSNDLINTTGIRHEEAEGIIQYPRMIKKVELAMVFRETDSGHVRVSFRSKGRFDVSALAMEFGGGGHVRAAGCRLELPLEEAKERVLARVVELLRE